MGESLRKEDSFSKLAYVRAANPTSGDDSKLKKSVESMEAWRNQMMQTTMRMPPSGRKFVSIQQVLSVDCELWAFLSQETRGKLKARVGDNPPLDEPVKKLVSSLQILCFMTPLPGHSNEAEQTKSQAAPSQVKVHCRSHCTISTRPGKATKPSSSSLATLEPQLKIYFQPCPRTVLPSWLQVNSFACATTMEHAGSRNQVCATWVPTCVTRMGVGRNDPTSNVDTDRKRKASTISRRGKVLL